jgi:predicted transcriptional regulator
MLKRHLTTAHGLTVDAYRTRWNLPNDHPMVAPAYSARRSGLAKEHGLGRRGGTSAQTAMVPRADTAAALQPSPKRRGRPRSTPTPASAE